MPLSAIRPRLRPKVRLRFDRHTGRHLLLYPEMGLELNDTATAIARLCTGEWTVDDMVEQLTRAYDDVSPDEIRRGVSDFLDVLSDRGLLQRTLFTTVRREIAQSPGGVHGAKNNERHARGRRRDGEPAVSQARGAARKGGILETVCRPTEQ